MDWSRLEVGRAGHRTRRGLCAGVDADGNAFVVRPARTCTRRTGRLRRDRARLLRRGRCIAQGEQTWLTGRGADGRLHLWSAYRRRHHGRRRTRWRRSTPCGRPRCSTPRPRWCSPRTSTGVRGGSGCYPREAAILGGTPAGRDLTMGTEPDTALAFAFYERSRWSWPDRWATPGHPMRGRWEGPTRSGAYPSLADPHRPVLGRHRSARPALLGRRALRWPAGDLPGAAPSVPRAAPHRHRRRASTPARPEDALAVSDRPVVLVDEHERDQPVFVAALPRGNRLCWHDGTEWKAHPVPEGRVRSACTSRWGRPCPRRRERSGRFRTPPERLTTPGTCEPAGGVPGCPWQDARQEVRGWTRSWRVRRRRWRTSRTARRWRSAGSGCAGSRRC